MSMQNYPIQEYGLIAYAKDLQQWWDEGTEGYGTPSFEQKQVDLYAVSECLPRSDSYCVVIQDPDGDCYAVTNDGSFVETEFGRRGEDFVILQLRKYPTLFKKAYSSKKEAVEELKESFSDILPDDFDYDNRFVMYQGTVCG